MKGQNTELRTELKYEGKFSEIKTKLGGTLEPINKVNNCFKEQNVKGDFTKSKRNEEVSLLVRI